MKQQDHIYGFAAFVRIGHIMAVDLLRIVAPSYTIAKAIAEREAREHAEHERDALGAVYGERFEVSVEVAPLQ